MGESVGVLRLERGVAARKQLPVRKLFGLLFQEAVARRTGGQAARCPFQEDVVVGTVFEVLGGSSYHLLQAKCVCESGPEAGTRRSSATTSSRRRIAAGGPGGRDRGDREGH